jgi:hypothetical protein
MKKDEQPREGEIILYTTPEGKARVEVFFQDETLWLSLSQIAELFQRDKSVISKHISNIFKEGELRYSSVVAKIATTAADGKTYQVEHFNLDVIIAVGYRVNSRQATQFRIWATKILREYIIKGFALDDERLKQGKRFGKDYFDELLERIREIRASERRFYLKITDIYEQCSIDYTREQRSPKLFSRRCRISSTGQLPAKPQLRSSLGGLMQISLTWV